ncbi:HORMA domain-containing protein [Capsaspora owczarzaki ATCC 30864]|uniref:HORMA domain-containing protein n=1 Tax=Capsaspora owczarzaki (strain ATCC 30864) TaxID=595528 RepID=A0A0D2VQD5_CAPO3|nr:HORMA domain-containing protein [Capsaspora owczarzaki ATCC 30864]
MNGQFDLPQSDELQGAASTSDGDSPAHEHHFAQPQHPQPAATAARASPPVAPVVAQPHQQHARLEQLPLSPEISQQDGSNPAEALRPRVNLSLSKPKSVASSVASVAPAAPDAAILHQATTERASQAVPIPNGKLANLAVPSSSAAAQSASQHESPHPPQVDRAPADDLVRCPCGVSETDGRMINCDRCGYWQHGVCFGFREGRKLQLDSHLCDLCHGLAASDAPVHHRMCSASTPSTSDRKQLALLRRALSAFVNGKTRSFTLQGMSNRLGEGVFIGSVVLSRGVAGLLFLQLVLVVWKTYHF